MRTLRAFSITELLVVCGVIAVIVGLTVPALRHVHRGGIAVACLSNLRQLGQAHTAYMAANKELFIDVGLPHGGLPDEKSAWINTLQSYYKEKLVLRSPADNSPHWPPDVPGGGTPVPSTGQFRRTSYGCNNYLSRNYTPAEHPTPKADRMSRVADPGNTVHFLIMAFEGDYAGSDHVHVEQWWNNAAGPDFPPVFAASQMQTNAHGGAPRSWNSESNYEFLDGHVETATFRRVYVNRDSRNRFDPEISHYWSGQAPASP
jgi:hypothetical protein